jgi:hypothetical protein
MFEVLMYALVAIIVACLCIAEYVLDRKDGR